jgi:hypothetical protein
MACYGDSFTFIFSPYHTTKAYSVYTAATVIMEKPQEHLHSEENAPAGA